LDKKKSFMGRNINREIKITYNKLLFQNNESKYVRRLKIV